MVNFRDKRVGGPLALLIAIVVTVTMALDHGGTATGSSAPAGATASSRTVAQNAQGELRSRIVGETGNGREVTGYFVPLNFSRNNGKVFARGLIHGVVHNTDGSTRTFDVMRTKRVMTIEGVPVQTRTQAAALRPRPATSSTWCWGRSTSTCSASRSISTASCSTSWRSRVQATFSATCSARSPGCSTAASNGLLGRLTDLLNRILGRLGLGL